eukprot:6357209-Alexandrium_andersonii.AAC.1
MNWKRGVRGHEQQHRWNTGTQVPRRSWHMKCTPKVSREVKTHAKLHWGAVPARKSRDRKRIGTP